MYKIGIYKGTDIMSELICTNYSILLVMSRFGISLGFADKTIDNVCKDNNVDTATFLAVVNLLNNEEGVAEDEDIQSLSLKSLVNYLRSSHSYFLEFRLPQIRKNLINALDCESNNLSPVIIRYFDEYAHEVHKHMCYEEDNIFPYIDEMIECNISGKYNIKIFSKVHDNIESLLDELKVIIINYYPAKTSNELNAVLFDIFSCSQELASHNIVEDSLLIPAIRIAESSLGLN